MQGPVAYEPLGEWCVRLRSRVDASAVAADHGLQVGHQLPRFGLALLRGPADPAALRSDRRVLAVEPNMPAVLADPLDLLMGFHQGEWDGAAVTTQAALAPLRLPEVHALARGDGVRIAVLDTGADIAHPHLARRVSGRASLLCGPPREQADLVDNDGDSEVDEAFGHGTHVAGIIATVAPDARIFAIPVLNDDGVGSTYDVAAGLYLARAWGVHIVNLSLKLSEHSDIVAEAIRLLRGTGTIVLAAAGNQAGPLSYPASDPNVVAVAATDARDALAEFSASEGAALAAPGVMIDSSYPGRLVARASGTSMSCAAASGSLALVASVRGIRSLEDALAALEHAAQPMAKQYGIQQGRVDPLAAVKQMIAGLLPEVDPMELSPP